MLAEDICNGSQSTKLHVPVLLLAQARVYALAGSE